MIEKRKHPRYVVEGLGIYAKTIFNTEVEILDISESGGSIKGAKRFCIGCEYSFKFDHGESSLSVKGVVVWEKLTGTVKVGEGEAVPIYTAGVEFRNGLADRRMEELKEILIDKVRERRLGGMKVSIGPSEKTVLSYLETCAVRDVSLGGMRIETGQEPTVDTIFSFELVLTEHEKAIACKGRIAFYQELQGKTPQRYSVGVEFVDMADEDVSRLRKFIDVLPSDIGETRS